MMQRYSEADAEWAHQSETAILKTIADLVAKRDFSRDVEHKQELLDCISILVRPWATHVDVL